MEQIDLGTVKPYGTLSGYCYLHIPQYLCKQFNITPSTVFFIIYRDGKIVIEQDVKEKAGVVAKGEG